MTDSFTPSTPGGPSSGTTSSGEPVEESVEGVPVIRDRRRLDPETGRVRQPAEPAGAWGDRGTQEAGAQARAAAPRKKGA